MDSPRDWLQLLYQKNLPTAAKRELVRRLGSPGAVLRADSASIAGILEAAAANGSLGRAVRRTVRMKTPPVDAELAVLAQLGGDFIGFNAPDFPPLLNQINSPPLGLFVRGDVALLQSPQLAVVGSRSPTPSGRRTTEQLAGDLSAAGLTITSGLALGIDSCAHRGCINAGGKTIAVTACGLDVVYPPGNAELMETIVAGGLIVSEYPPGAAPRRQHFPRRNRLISGLALGTLVVEAGIQSGSLITARLAGEQGREVFAVPGSIHSPASRGCHKLLRQGAKLVETADDILEEIGQFFTPAKPAGTEPTKPATAEAAVAGPVTAPPPLYDLIDYAPTGIDQLIQQSGLTADEVSYILTELELSGLVAASDGGYQRLPQ